MIPTEMGIPFEATSLIAWPIAAVFLISGGAKLLANRHFRLVLLETYQLPAAIAVPSSVLIPLAELVTALLLLSPWWALGFASAASLMLAIGAVVVAAWASGLSGECGCLGGRSNDTLSSRTVLRAMGLLLASEIGLTLYLVEVTRPSPHPFETLAIAASIYGLSLALILTLAALTLLSRLSRLEGAE